MAMQGKKYISMNDPKLYNLCIYRSFYVFVFKITLYQGKLDKVSRHCKLREAKLKILIFFFSLI